MSSFTFKPPQRTVHTVFVHCSASDQPAHDDVSVMRSWHLANGWADVGYHYFVKKDGTIQPGRSLEQTPAAQSEWNPGTIAICLHGLRRDAFTAAQLEALIDFATVVRDAYAEKGVRIRFRGHVEVANKACPVIDYRRVLGLDIDGHMTHSPDASPQPGGVIAGNVPSDPGAHGAKSPAAPASASRWTPEVLRKFATGARVADLQRALNAAGAGLVVDGDYGRATEDAVKAFQEARGLVVDGVAGPATWAALGMARAA